VVAGIVHHSAGGKQGHNNIESLKDGEGIQAWKKRGESDLTPPSPNFITFPALLDP
jgi:hypothetical protein